MEKQELLSEVRHMLASGQITKDELLAVSGNGTPSSGTSTRNLNLAEILYYIGGGIVFLGIIVLCYQNWNYFSSFLRIFVTLGSCVAAFVVAAMLHRYENFTKISQAFFLICGMLAPLAAYVTFYESGFDTSSNFIQLAIYIILACLFFAAFWSYRQTILLFFTIVFATGLFHFIISLIVGNGLLPDTMSKVWEYEILVIGLGYTLLGYYLTTTTEKALSGVMYAFGSIFFLGSAMALGGWQPNQNAFWELIYPLLVFGVIFLSVQLKSKAFLVFGTLFLIGYILKLTGEYFTSGLGWPLALVLAGLVIIGIGYYAVRINKKYLSPMS